MRIDYLADHPEFIPVLAPEIAAHWRRLIPLETVAARTAKLRTHLNREVLPIAWVAHAGGEVFGTAALRINDLDERDDLSPWLGGVFVREPFRRRGIATALCQVAEAKAQTLGIGTLHLFTLDQQALYAGWGWKLSKEITWRGFKAAIMTKPMHPC